MQSILGLVKLLSTWMQIESLIFFNYDYGNRIVSIVASQEWLQ